MSKSKLTEICEKLPHILVIKADERKGPWCNGLQASWIIKDELERIGSGTKIAGLYRCWVCMRPTDKEGKNISFHEQMLIYTRVGQGIYDPPRVSKHFQGEQVIGDCCVEWLSEMQSKWAIKSKIKSKNKTGTVHNWKGKKFK